MSQRQKLLRLAVRSRQWMLDDRTPGLRQALADEAEASRQARQADDRLEAMHRATSALLGRATFRADELAQYASYEALQRQRVATAAQALEESRDVLEQRRAEVQAVLSERDALQERLEQRLRDDAAQRQRAVARSDDEAWLARRTPETKDCDAD